MILLSLLIGPGHKGRPHFNGQRGQRCPAAVAECAEQSGDHGAGWAQVRGRAIGGIDQREQAGEPCRKALVAEGMPFLVQGVEQGLAQASRGEDPAGAGGQVAQGAVEAAERERGVRFDAAGRVGRGEGQGDRAKPAEMRGLGQRSDT